VVLSDNNAEWLEGMAAKKEQWAACWTWGVCTYGVHSTQRIEAIHSAINVWCSKSMLLVELFVELESREALRRMHSETKAHRAAFKHAAMGPGGLYPPVAALSSSLTAYAFDLQCAQAREKEFYTALGPDERGVYTVARMPGTTRPRLERDAEGARSTASAPDDVIDIDHGLDADPAPRRTSLTACSCQLTTQLGVICRHRLRVMQQCNLTELPMDAFHEFWLADSNDERVPLPGPQPLARAAVPMVISAAQHKAELVSHLMALADMAHTRADWRLATKRSAAQLVAAMLADDSTTELDEDGAGAGRVLVANPYVPAKKQQQKRKASGVPGAPGGAKKTSKSHKKKPHS
jgi:hypothetical protein